MSSSLVGSAVAAALFIGAGLGSAAAPVPLLGGWLFGVGAGVTDRRAVPPGTCQLLRCRDDGDPAGPGSRRLDPPSPEVIPRAAGLSFGNSSSGGGGMGSWVNGDSASATSTGVW